MTRNKWMTTLIMAVAIWGVSILCPQNNLIQPAFAEEGDYVLGSIRLFPYNYAPKGWAPCTGYYISPRDHKPLYQLYGDYLYCNPAMIQMPDLRNSSPIPGVNYYMAVEGEYPSLSYTETTLIGEVCLFPKNYEPPNYLPCDGSMIKIDSDSNALFSVIGTTYGGDGQDSFRVPDLKDHTPEDFTYWIAFRGVTPDSDYYGYDLLIGAIPLLAFDLTKDYSYLCEGQDIDIKSHIALYTLLKDNFDTDNSTYITLPDLRGAAPVAKTQYSIFSYGRWPIPY